MSPLRRRALLAASVGLGGAAVPWPALAGSAAPDDDRVAADRRLLFPRDHGAHNGARIEWWYATGWLQAPGAGTGTGPGVGKTAATGTGNALWGFQLTFFRSRTGLADTLPGRFAPRQLLFAHAALTDVAGGRHLHAQRISRWSGDAQLPEAHASRGDTGLAIGRWALQRDAASGQYQALLAAPDAGFTLALQLQPSQPLLLQGDAGFSRKGPLPSQASHYYSQPQLAVQATLTLAGRRLALPGRGWLDHEWSDNLLAPGAVGWDWIGINLANGSALTAFVLRRADGSVLWAGGSHRAAGGLQRAFAADAVQFTPQRSWTSPATGGRYPVQWQIDTPAGRFGLRALLDAQELDSRASTGTVYWEGLAELLDGGGARIGLGYLEMTGRAQPLTLGG